MLVFAVFLHSESLKFIVSTPVAKSINVSRERPTFTQHLGRERATCCTLVCLWFVVGTERKRNKTELKKRISNILDKDLNQLIYFISKFHLTNKES